MADLTTTLVPFLFVLAVSFGALEISEVFRRKQVNLIISLAFAFYAVTSPWLVSLINSVLPYAIALMIGLFFLGFLLKFFGGKGGEKDYTLIILALLLFLVFAANYGLGFLEDIFPSIGEEELMTGLGLAVMAIIFYSVYRLWTKGS